jgi:hypothetical protein
MHSGGIHDLFDLIFRSIIRGSIYKFIFHSPTSVVLTLFCVAVFGFLFLRKGFRR